MITDQAKVICASKYFTVEQIKKLYELGVRDFGENRVQDMLKKMEDLSDLPIVWHFIGHLQTNKVKAMINKIDILHTLDRLSLAQFIQTYREKPLPCFIQVNLTEESQKSGINPENLAQFFNDIKNYDKIEIIGFMTMGKDDDLLITEKAFRKLDELASLYQFPYRSMGMTNDYELALKYHATHLRIGRKFLEFI